MKEMILAPLRELREYEELRERMRKETGILSLTGCIEAEKAHMIYGLSFDVPCVLVVVENEYAARNLVENLRFYASEVLYYPAKDLLFYQADVASNALDRQRIAVMRKLAESKHPRQSKARHQDSVTGSAGATSCQTPEGSGTCGAAAVCGGAGRGADGPRDEAGGV